LTAFSWHCIAGSYHSERIDHRIRFPRASQAIDFKKRMLRHALAAVQEHTPSQAPWVMMSDTNLLGTFVREVVDSLPEPSHESEPVAVFGPGPRDYIFGNSLLAETYCSGADLRARDNQHGAIGVQVKWELPATPSRVAGEEASGALDPDAAAANAQANRIRGSMAEQEEQQVRDDTRQADEQQAEEECAEVERQAQLRAWQETTRRRHQEEQAQLLATYRAAALREMLLARQAEEWRRQAQEEQEEEVNRMRESEAMEIEFELAQRVQEQELEREALAALAASQGLRRQGLPTRSLVDRRGDLYVVTGGARAAMVLVLQLRIPELRKGHQWYLEDELPLEACRRVQKQVFDAWLEEPEGRERSNEAGRDTRRW